VKPGRGSTGQALASETSVLSTLLSMLLKRLFLVIDAPTKKLERINEQAQEPTLRIEHCKKKTSQKNFAKDEYSGFIAAGGNQPI